VDDFERKFKREELRCELICTAAVVGGAVVSFGTGMAVGVLTNNPLAGGVAAAGTAVALTRPILRWTKSACDNKPMP
jgi:ApbE superfamily uncharacterized protein (UPF0280 family)